MDGGRYRGGSTPGGKWGCGLAALFGLPVFFSLVLWDNLGDCVPDVQCHKGSWLWVVLPTILVAAPVGFGVRWLANRRLSDVSRAAAEERHR